MEVSEEATPTIEELEARAKAAVAEWKAATASARTPGGQFVKGNTASLKAGQRSERWLELPDVAAWHAERTAAIVQDLGGAQEISTLQHGTAREAARVEVILGALGDEILAGGVLTPKGKTRATTTIYLKTLDRYVNLAKALGLAKRIKTVASFKDAVRG